MAIPLDVLSCKVSGRFLHANPDGRDEGREPDGDPWVGLTVEIEATIPFIRNLRTDPAALVTLDPFTLRTDSNGDMVAPDGEPSILVVASDDPYIIPSGNWYYIATVSGDGFPVTRIAFEAKGNGTFDLIRDADVPLDLETALTGWKQAVADVRALIAGFEGTAIAVLDD